MALDILTILMMAFVLILAYTGGTVDEAMSTVVGARILSSRNAVIFGGIATILGTMFYSDNIGKTIGKDILGTGVVYTQQLLLSVVITTSAWLLIASTLRVTVSTTQTIVGAIIGVGIVQILTAGLTIDTALNLLKILEIASGWVISPTLAFICSYFMAKFLRKNRKYIIQFVLKRRGEEGSGGLRILEEIEKYYSIIFLGVIFWAEFARGANNNGNPLGIVFGLVQAGTIRESDLGIWKIAIAIMYFIGLNTLGKPLVEKTGATASGFRPSDGLATVISASLVTFIGITIALPTTATQIMMFSIFGAGFSIGEKPNKKDVFRMFRVWLLTLPMAAVFSSLSFIVISAIF